MPCCWPCTARWSPRACRTSKASCCDSVRGVIGPEDAAGGDARSARQRHRADGRARRRPGAVSHGAAHRRVRDRPARRPGAAPDPGRRRPAGDGVPESCRWSCRPSGPTRRTRPASASRFASGCKRCEADPGVLTRRPGDRAAVARHPRAGQRRGRRHRRRRDLGRGSCCRRSLAEVWAPPPRVPAASWSRLADAVRLAHEELATAWSCSSDGADATTSGAPGDSTWLLARAAEVRLAAAGAGDAGGPGGRRGGAHGAASARDWTAHARRRARSALLAAADVDRARSANLFDARFMLSGHLGKNLPIDMGPSAVLRHGNVPSSGHVAFRAALRPGVVSHGGPRSVRGQRAGRQEPVRLPGGLPGRRRRRSMVRGAGLRPGRLLELRVSQHSATALAVG